MRSARLAASFAVLSLPVAFSAVVGHGRAVLSGHVPHRVEKAVDLGPVTPDTPVEGMLFFRISAEKQRALDQFLADLQSPKSSSFRKWITPAEFGDRFGADPADIERVKAWLGAESLTIEEVTAARTLIRFSGSSRNVEHAFQTELHRFSENGHEHFSNISDPSIPAEFAPFVAGVHGLNDFRPRPNLRRYDLPFPAAITNLTPAVIASIYDVEKLVNAGYIGTGVKIAVAGQANIDPAIAGQFRAEFGLSATYPQLVVAGSGFSSDSGDNDEAQLDVQWAGAIANNAEILYVRSRDVGTSALYAINQNLAPILTISYGECERDESGGEMAATRTAIQQANAQGMSVIVASGDAGPATCDWDPDNPETAASQGLAVSFPASIPEVTAVGGTQFNEVANGYYYAQPSPTAYIPEVVWNDPGFPFAASGGGVSAVFTKPAWQNAPGVPADGARDVPDIALDASDVHDPYPVCFTSACGDLVGGTSAAAPVFASILGVVLSYEMANNGVATGLGNINPLLYQFAQTSPAALHDVIQGNNYVPCQAGSPDCLNGSYFGYAAGPGYDLATGLGSVDGFELSQAFNRASLSRATVSVDVPVSAVCFSNGAASIPVLAV